MRHATAALLIGLAFPFGLPLPACAEQLKAVVFAIEPQQIPDTPALRDKLQADTELLRRLVAAHGLAVVDTGPQAKKIADNTPLGDCNGCDQDIAKALGADLEVATSIQQISAAVFNLGGSIKDVKTNRVLRQGVVALQGDDAANWAHGVKFLVKERLFQPPLPTTADGLAAAVQKKDGG